MEIARRGRINPDARPKIMNGRSDAGRRIDVPRQGHFFGHAPIKVVGPHETAVLLIGGLLARVVHVELMAAEGPAEPAGSLHPAQIEIIISRGTNRITVPALN